MLTIQSIKSMSKKGKQRQTLMPSGSATAVEDKEEDDEEALTVALRRTLRPQFGVLMKVGEEKRERDWIGDAMMAFWGLNERKKLSTVEDRAIDGFWQNPLRQKDRVNKQLLSLTKY